MRIDKLLNTLATISLLIAFIVAGHGVSAHEQPMGEARYLGNEGVLVAVAGHKVLVDAFYAQSFSTYSLVPERLVTDMMSGRPPYNDVAAVFVSHVHGDHFSPAPMLAYLRAQPQVRLFCPTQVLDKLRQSGADAELLNRVTAFDLAPGDAPATQRSGALEIDVVALPHAGGARMADVRNLSFRVSLGNNHTFIHLGDAAIDKPAFARQADFWAARNVDTVFPPYWFLGDETGLSLLADFLAPGQVIGIHVPAAATGQGDAWRAQLGADLFTDPGEFRRLAHQH
jgi:L-ascorbate metabolism protein UlaG (beta-lactamase superfamily)